MKTILAACLVMTTLFSGITIEKAWEKVEYLNDKLKAAQSDIEYASLKRDSAKMMDYPVVSLTASYTHLNEPIGLDISNISSRVNPILGAIGGAPLPSEIDFLDQNIALADLQLLLPLYTGGKISAAQDAYGAKVIEAVALKHMQRDKAFLKLIRYYYGVVMTQSLHTTRLEAQKALQLHYNNSRKLKKEGQISRAELLNAQVKLNAAKIETRKAEHKMEIVASAFSKLIKEKNMPKSHLFISHKLGGKSEYTARSVEDNAGIAVLNAKSKEADAMIKVEKSAWHPTIMAYGNVNLHKGDSILEEMAPSSMAGVMLKWDLFGGKDRNKEIEAAKVLRSKVSSLKAQAQEDLKLAVEKIYNEMMLYREEFESLSASLSLAQENYKLQTLAFSEGLGTSAEVVDAQMFLSGAKTKRLNAAYNYVIKLSELCVFSGDAELFFRYEKDSRKVK